MRDAAELFLQDVIEDESLQSKVASMEVLLNTLLTEVRELKAMETREIEAGGGGVTVTVTGRDENGQIKTIRIGNV